MTHTPGPWVAITKGMDAKVECPDGRSFLIGDIIYHEDNKANARLIAAAPELLDALKMIANQRGMFSHQLATMAKEAIAKAEAE